MPLIETHPFVFAAKIHSNHQLLTSLLFFTLMLHVGGADFKTLVPGYEFADGEKYGEFKPGDHVAEIGLAALITGGAAAVAAKKGWFAAIGIALAKFWKLILIGVVGIGAAIRKLFSGKKDTPAS